MLLVPLTAMAEEITDPHFVLEVSSVKAELTEDVTIKVPIKASANKGYAYGSAKVTWDSEALELTGVEFTDAAPDNKSSAITNSGEYTVRFGDNLATNNFTKTGTFFTLVFKPTDKAETKSYDIAIGEMSVSDAADNVVEAYSIAGRITLSAYTDDGLVLEAVTSSAYLSEGEVSVPVRAEKNDGFKTASIFINWDENAMELDNVKFGSIPDNGSAAGETAGSYLVKLGKNTASSDYTSTGAIFTLNFKLKSGVAQGSYPVTLAAAFANSLNGDRVKTALTSGKVNIVDDSGLYVETVVRPTDAPEETGQPETEPADADNFGKVGDANWRFDPASGSLIISGDGAMANYASKDDVPFAKHADKIKSVTVSKGVTEIGDYCFAGLTALTSVSLTSGLSRIGTSAFEDSALSEISIPTSVTEIGENAIGYKTNGVDGEGDAIHEKTGAVVIKCESGSAAEAYCEEIGIQATIIEFTDPTEPDECTHADLDDKIVLPDISTGADGYEKVVCKSCGKVLVNITLSCPVITLSKTKYTYSGKTCKPKVTMYSDGEVVPADGNYTLKYTANKNAGTGKVTVTMAENSVAQGAKTLTFTISKAKNPMTAKANAKTVKLKDVKKKKVTVKKAITVKKNQGKVSYAAVKKGTSKGVSISAKGVITIKKAATKKKTTLKIVVNVTAKGDKNYKKLTKKVTVSIKVK